VLSGRAVRLEPGFPADVVETLKVMGHEVAFASPDVAFGFGGAQIVRRIDGGYIAGSDPRKDGCAAGY
jgi:gamma-glutamyltranspeptidase/glutathione hydrolase